jgi:hypothetical protein
MSKNRLFLAAMSLAVIMLMDVSRVSAEGCPRKAVAENGGKHWCYDAEGHGHVHLWKPPDYDPLRAATIVYVHGYNLTTDENQVTGAGDGEDGCANLHYVDCAWDKHRLARQFSKSGLNALFVAIEGPNNDNQRPKWRSLEALLDSIRIEGGVKPSPKVTAVGHSAGIFTVVNFLLDERLRQVVVLDALYTRAPRMIKSWFESAKNRHLTLVGAEANFETTSAFSKKLGCTLHDGTAPRYSEEQKNVRCLSEIDQDVKHMDVIRDGEIMPLVLTRTLIPPPPVKASCKHEPCKPKRNQKVRKHQKGRHAEFRSVRSDAVISFSDGRTHSSVAAYDVHLYAHHERPRTIRSPTLQALAQSPALARHLRQRGDHQLRSKLRLGQRQHARKRRHLRHRPT